VQPTIDGSFAGGISIFPQTEKANNLEGSKLFICMAETLQHASQANNDKLICLDPSPPL